jgi:hypothetical protein
MPVFAATNPFVDVPLNHWAYDAVSQLATRSILSGYPNGAYKGKQPVTRYEMASALARGLAVTDMSKADKQDVEILRRLLTEFKDELDALGVKTDAIDRKVGITESRLGGWKLSGELRLDVVDWGNDNQDGSIELWRSRLIIQRWFGENEYLHFYARLDGSASGVNYHQFYVEFPAWQGVNLTAGRFAWSFENEYGFLTGFFTEETANDAYLAGFNDTRDGIGFSKSWRFGEIRGYVARPNKTFGVMTDNLEHTTFSSGVDAWELAGAVKWQITEHFGLDIGLQTFIGDDASVLTDANGVAHYKLNNLYTLFGGIRFNFNRNIALKGIYYYQDSEMDAWEGSDWTDMNNGKANAWKIIADVKQDFFKFTSLWLEYSSLEQGFFIPVNTESIWLLRYPPRWSSGKISGILPADTGIWRIGAKQQWNEKWRSWLYVAGHSFDYEEDAKATQWGVGIEYQYNPNVIFIFNYLDVNWNKNGEDLGFVDDHRFQFRTEVLF